MGGARIWPGVWRQVGACMCERGRRFNPSLVSNLAFVCLVSGKNWSIIGWSVHVARLQQIVPRKKAGAFGPRWTLLRWCRLLICAIVRQDQSGVAGCLALADNPRLGSFGLWPFVPATNVAERISKSCFPPGRQVGIVAA